MNAGASSTEESLDGALRRAVERFNDGDFFACHEILEEPWLRLRGSERDFLKGLIHAAVALHHLQRGNAHGARVKFRSSRRYLEPFLPRWRGLDLEALLGDMEALLAPVLAGAAAAAPQVAPGEWPRLRAAAGFDRPPPGRK